MAWKIFDKISNAVNELVDTASKAAHAVYHEVASVMSGAGKTIESAASGVKDELNHVVDTAGKLASKVVDTGSDLIKNTENKFSSIVSTPLMLIAAGIAGLLIFNSKDVAQVATKAIDKY